MSGYTPGPWKIRESDGTEMGHPFRTVCDAEYSPLARINGLGPSSQANARLVAAAPELLEELEKLVEVLTPIWREYVDALNKAGQSAPANIALRFETARAAIAKVRGQS